MEALVEEEVWDEVMDLCNAITLEYWDIINDISKTFSHNVVIVSLKIILLKIVRNLSQSANRRMFHHYRTITRM